jgi:hypothetical protein
MNPSLSARVIERAFEKDAAAADAEYGANFRSDIQSLFDLEVVEAAIDRGCFERPRVPGLRYVAFVDAAGGSGGGDSMTMAVAHAERDVTVLDFVREVPPPFIPSQVCAEFASVMKGYGVTRMAGDKWGSEFVRERFRDCGITLEPSERTKSDLYLELLPILSSGRIRLIDNKRLLAQLIGLERRTARSGRDSVDHGPGQHDDIANSVAGALVSAGVRPGHWVVSDELLAYASRPRLSSSSRRYW